MTNIVHVVGTGTIGEPLINLLVHHKKAFGIDEVTFHKRTPSLSERGKIADLMSRGAVLVTDEDKTATFVELGMTPAYEQREAVERASVVIDCTPIGNRLKEELYADARGPRGFLAQGSEYGFGKPYAYGINDAALIPEHDRYIHVVSCNTHNMAALIRTIACDDGGDGEFDCFLLNGDFTLLRRANDISQTSGFPASPTMGRHDDAVYGTHHARDVAALFRTMHMELPVFSTAIKLPSQYMHALRFRLTLSRKITRSEVEERIWKGRFVAPTYKNETNTVFSFGRDHGFFGRILNQAVVPLESLTVINEREVVGTSFTPQDGNPLLSSVAATLWYLYQDSNEIRHRMRVLNRYLFSEI